MSVANNQSVTRKPEKIVLITIGDKTSPLPLIQQNTEYATVLLSAYDVEELYQVHQENPAQFFLLLNEHSDFVDSTVLDKMLEPLLEYPEVGYVYSDIKVRASNNTTRPILFPSFNPYPDFKNVIINAPFMYRAQLIPQFNPQLTVLYMHDALLSLWEKAIGYHIPECLFLSTIKSDSYKADMEVIQHER